MATITINLPLIPERVITVPNDKLKTLSGYYNVNVKTAVNLDGDPVTPTDKDIANALADAIVNLLKGPIVQGRKHEAMRAVQDISDVMTDSVST